MGHWRLLHADDEHLSGRDALVRALQLEGERLLYHPGLVFRLTHRDEADRHGSSLKARRHLDLAVVAGETGPLASLGEQSAWTSEAILLTDHPEMNVLSIERVGLKFFDRVHADLPGHRAMTHGRAVRADRDAYNDALAPLGEMRFEPDSGAIWYNNGTVVGTRARDWKIWTGAVPEDGWYHEQPCDCQFDCERP